MTDVSGDFSSWVFQVNVEKNFGEFSLDSRMLQLMMQLDGKKDMGTILRGLTIGQPAAQGLIEKLLALELVIRVKTPSPCLPGRFMATLVTALAQAMGPIAEVVLEDELADMSLSAVGVPVPRAAELIERLAGQVPRAEKRTVFQRTMIEALKTV